MTFDSKMASACFVGAAAWFLFSSQQNEACNAIFDMIDGFNFKDMKYGVMLYVYRGVYYLN